LVLAGHTEYLCGLHAGRGPPVGQHCVRFKITKYTVLSVDLKPQKYFLKSVRVLGVLRGRFPLLDKQAPAILRHIMSAAARQWLKVKVAFDIFFGSAALIRQS